MKSKLPFNFSMSFATTNPEKKEKRLRNLLALLVVLMFGVNVVHAQLLQWNTFGNLGTETSEPSIFNNTNILAATLNYSGSAVTPAANSSRFGGSNWGLASISTDKYVQFTVTPNSGFSFTPTSFVFQWDKSGTGPKSLTLRSSADAFSVDLGTIANVAVLGTSNTIAISGLTNLTTATTFRIYGYGATGSGGTGGFDVSTNIVNVQLNGTTSAVATPSLSITGTTAHGSTCTNTAASTKTYTITNTGTAASNVVVSSSDAQFVVSNLSSTSIGAANGTATYDVTFTPSSSGAKTATITVYYDTSTSATTSSLTGTGTTSVTQAVTSSAASSVTAKSATLNGNYTTVGVCPATIEKGFVYSLTTDNNNPLVAGTGVTKTSVTLGSTGSYTLGLTNLPSSSAYSFKAYVYDGTTYTYGTVQTFTTSAALAITGTLNNGTVCPNVPATPVTYTVTNNGATTVTGISVASSDPQFVVSSISSSTIAAAGTATYTVTFTPTSPGSKSATVTVSGTAVTSVTHTPTGTGTTPVTAAVTSNAASSIGTTTATLNGNVTTLGVCPNTTQKGFVYALTSASASPTNGDGVSTTASVLSLVTGACTLSLTGLTQGTSYSFRAYVFDGSTYTYGTVLTFTTLTPPANDDCSGAIALTMNAAAITADVTAATESIPAVACSLTGDANDDVWYSFTTAHAGDYTLTVVGSSSFDAVVDLRSGACNGTNLDCADVTGSGGIETLTSSLSASTTYFIRVYSYDGVPSTTTFTIKVASPLLYAPVATAATGVGSSAFTANWNAVSGATGYELDVSPYSIFLVPAATESFDNSLVLFSGSGGTYFNGLSASGDRPASSPFAFEGTYGYGITNGSAVLTSSNINTTTLTNLELSFKLASFSIGNTNNGADGADIVTVEISPNGGTNYYSTLRVLGNSNANWGFSASGNATISYDGNASPVDFSPSGGGTRTTDGYSNIVISNLPSTTNLKIRITLLNNASQERWVIDDLKVATTTNAFVAGYEGLQVTNATQVVTGLSPATNYYYRVRVKDFFNINSTNSNIITLKSYNDISTADFRSKTSGNFNSLSTWEYNTGVSSVGTAGWLDATQIPTSANNVKVQSAHSVSLTADISLNTSKSITVDGVLNTNTNKITGAGNLLINATGTLGIGSTSTSGAFEDTVALTGSVNLLTGSTVDLNGSGAQFIATNTFSNLKINNTFGVTALGNLTVNGELYLATPNASSTKGALDMASNTLNMGETATTSGVGDVSGVVSRTTFVAGNAYSFGNTYTTITFPAGGTLPSALAVKLTLTTPFWSTPSDAVARYYGIVQNGGSNQLVTFKAHYLDTELGNVIENSTIDFFDFHGSTITHDHGHNSENSSQNWIQVDNINLLYFAPSSSDFTVKSWYLGQSVNPNFTWLGAESSNWMSATNWSGGVPTNINDVIIPDASTTDHDPTLSTASIQSISLASGAILNGGSATLTLTKSGGAAWMKDNATFNPDTSTILFTGTGSTIGGTTTFNNISIGSGASTEVSNSAQVSISGILINNGTFLTNDVVVLLSNATNSSKVGISTGVFNGKFKVERYIPLGKRAYRFLAPGVTTTNYISNNWQLATHITGSTTGANGFDQTGSGSPSMYTYNNQVGTGTGWTAIANTNATKLEAEKGYRLLVRGDRTPALLTTAAADNMNTAITLSATGTLKTGDVTINASSTPVAINNTNNATTNGFSLVGNPYVSPIDWHTVTKTNLNDTYYLWDANVGTSSQRGRYVSYSQATGLNNYGNTGVSVANRYIQSGQAFFVKNAVLGTAGSLTFHESDKVTSSPFGFRTDNQQAVLSVLLYSPTELALGGYPMDGITSVFGANFDNQIDYGDVAKLESAGENIAWYSQATKLDISAQAPVVSSDVLAIKSLRLGANKSYTFRIKATNFDPSLTGYLVDNYLNTQQEIDMSQDYFATFTTSTEALSYGEDRFKIVFGASLENEQFDSKSLTIYPNPVIDNQFSIQLPASLSGKLVVKIHNTLGQELHQVQTDAVPILLVNPPQVLAAGMYIVSVSCEGKEFQQKIMVK